MATKKVKELTVAQELLQAVNFVMPVQKKRGTVEENYIYIGNGWVVGCNEYMCIAHPVATPIVACPSSFQLQAALKKCGEDLSITSISDDQISLTSGDFKALITCVKNLDLRGPDQMTVPVDDKLKQCFKEVKGLAVVNQQYPELGSVKLSDGCCLAITPAKTALLQSWHGFPIPGTHLVPRAACDAISRPRLPPLNGVGMSESSVTFHYENGAFVKTALHSGQFVDIESLFNAEASEPYTMPDNFYQAVKAIETFSTEGFLHFKGNCITSDVEENQASTYKMENVPDGVTVSLDLYLKIRNSFQDVRITERSLLFQKGNTRGAIALVSMKDR